VDELEIDGPAPPVEEDDDDGTETPVEEEEDAALTPVEDEEMGSATTSTLVSNGVRQSVLTRSVVEPTANDSGCAVGVWNRGRPEVSSATRCNGCATLCAPPPVAVVYDTLLKGA